MADFPITSLSTLNQDPAKLERAQCLQKIRTMRFCSERCPAFEVCPAMATSFESDGPKKLCALKNQPKTVQQRFERLFLSGQSGLLQEMMTSLYKVGELTDKTTNIEDHREYSKLIINAHKALYGNKLEISSDTPTKIEIELVNLEEQMDIIDLEESESGAFTDKSLSYDEDDE